MAKENIDINSVITTSVYVLIFTFIGLPLWWKTTEVYRYPIPHASCQNLLSEKIKHMIFIKIILEDPNVQQGFFWEELLNIMNQEKEDKQPIIRFQWSMSVALEDELLIHNFSSVSDLDEALLLHDKVDDTRKTDKKFEGLKIVVLNNNFTNGPRLTIGNGKYGYILNNKDYKGLAEDVVFLAKKMGQVERLQKLYTPPALYSDDKTDKSNFIFSNIMGFLSKLNLVTLPQPSPSSTDLMHSQRKPDKDKMRYLKVSKSFDITLSLIVPEPQILQVNWNVERAINEYLKGFLEQLKKISTIRIKSQVLYMTSLPIPNQLSLNEDKEFILQSEYLPSLINPIEDKLGSDTSVQPNLNFVLYIPPKHQAPLRIHNSEGQPLPSNAFLLPQWGGFMIYNCLPPENASLPHSLDLNMQSVMEVFISQLRLLIGLSDIGSLSNEIVMELKGPILREWEMDFLLRKNAQEQISSSMSSLSSLSHLLQKIRNIVIKDDIGEKIHASLLATKESLQLLSDGHLEEGFMKAQTAFISADEAFYDPSLLALLYFPENQKYAIYIPLFLPISIPVITSLVHLWKFWEEQKHKIKKD